MTVASQSNLVLTDRYRLDAPLGQRSDGWLCRAHDLVLGRPVLVKMFKSLVDNETALAFAARVESLAGLRHAHLVALYDGGVADGHPYLVLEPVDGVDLLDVTGERQLSPAEVAALGAGLADALAHMHAEGIVHGGLTPASVLVDVDAKWRLVGPGVAHDVTEAADVHALGLVLLNCLDRGNGPIPGPLARVLAAMTYRHPERRPSAAVGARRLRQAAGTLESPTAALWRGRVAGLAVVSGVLAAAAIALVPTSMPPDATPPVAMPVPTAPDSTPQQPAAPPLPTTSAQHTTTTQPRPTASAHPPTVSAGPTTTAATTTVTTTTTTADTTTTENLPPGLAKKHKVPPGWLRKLFGDGWSWPFDW